MSHHGKGEIKYVVKQSGRNIVGYRYKKKHSGGGLLYCLYFITLYHAFMRLRKSSLWLSVWLNMSHLGLTALLFHANMVKGEYVTFELTFTLRWLNKHHLEMRLEK